MMAIDKQQTDIGQKPLRGELLRNEPMARHTSWRVGGLADCLYVPVDKQDLIAFIRQLPPDEPLMFLGLGSNVLIRDGGIRGTVIGMKNALTQLSIETVTDTGAVIYAEAGVPCAQLARYSVKQGLTGGEFFAGIPGTVGGALAMNAGAFGGETWRQVSGVETVDRRGGLHNRNLSDYVIGYRSVSRPGDEWFVSARFTFKPDTVEAGEARIKALLNKRSDTQPIGVYSCGSVFRNPQGDYAARLIESIGLKGKQIGGAEVSGKHANFIVNTGRASAADIEELIGFVQKEVHMKTGVMLQPEVLIVGEAPA